MSRVRTDAVETRIAFDAARADVAKYVRVGVMNRRLSDAIDKIRSLPEERQQQAAALLLDFLEHDDRDVQLTPEQLAEIEQALADDEPYASDEEVRVFFDRLLK
jgi:hypothetical protein